MVLISFEIPPRFVVFLQETISAPRKNFKAEKFYRLHLHCLQIALFISYESVIKPTCTRFRVKVNLCLKGCSFWKKFTKANSKVTTPFQKQQQLTGNTMTPRKFSSFFQLRMVTDIDHDHLIWFNHFGEPFEVNRCQIKYRSIFVLQHLIFFLYSTMQWTLWY